MDGWQYADGSTVPTVIMDCMRREEPSTVEKTQTDHIVPDTDRGLEESSFRSIDDLVNSIDPPFVAECCDEDFALSTEQTQPSPGDPATPVPDSAAVGLEVDTVCETSTSGMFPLDGPAAFAETDKLSFLADIVNANPDRHGNSVPLEQAYANLTEDRLKRAEVEMRETRTTSDPDISVLLRELSIFGHAQPLSNESRLLMRRKIQALDIRAGMPAIWITISPNDINNPVKMKLAIHRLHDYESAKELLADLREKYDRIALSTMDPVSSAIFFHREISLFFEKYVNTGRESIFGKISHYPSEARRANPIMPGGDSDCEGWMQKLRRPDQYAVPIFQGYISDDHEDDHPVYIKRKSAEAARKDAKLWASRSEGDDTIDVEYPLGDGRYEEEPPAMAHRQAYRALLQILRNAVQDTDATKDSPVLGGLIHDLWEENPAGEEQPFVQRQEDLYRNMPHDQGDALCQLPISRDDVQAAAKAQQLLHLRMLDDIEGGSQGTMLSADGADIDDTLARYGDTESLLGPGSDLNERGPRMLVDVSPATSFAEMGHTAAASFTLNYLQTMALQLVCLFLDKYTANPDSAGQHLQYTGGPGGTGKSRIIDALKDVFAARNQPHLLQITGTSGSSAAQIGGTTINSACGLIPIAIQTNRLPFSEAKKWIWKQKLVLVIDEVSMLGGATLHNVSHYLQALRDCPDEPFGGMPVVLLMGDFYQFAPVRETSLLIIRPPDRTETPLRQATISRHSGCRLWHLFKTVVLLEDQVRARNDPQLRALLDRVRNGRQTHEDLILLNANIVGRSQITFHDGLRAITPLNRTRWALNMEAVVGWARFNKRHIRIFVSTHTWRNGTLSPNLIARTIGQGDDSACKVPGVFFYAQSMPVVVNKNIYTGLKVMT
ncbi:PIF1-like helicase domain-containing protein [Hirsutella rhossiliensis]|uniref:ATP-dependent DNA helicase n=1 Tax=Hirsutella rhossiliensis TaxID=111463 RepID=A0A9P8MIV8_9HYPO|nr:PIF1-like helicase domain-containing protein [Hirsutella rhossiliensis]KAH0957178.1 PIF1-like helicase domain-containing protein [Hirsutella rhossiliensis]